jgi:trehalose-6-phosphate synthase
MLGSDLIGFHISDYVDSFLKCVTELLPAETRVDFQKKVVFYQNREIQVGAFPISIDFDQIQHIAHSESARSLARKLRSSFEEEFIGIGIDRLDYTKGILERLEAISTFFEEYPHYKKRMVFIQIAVPSRTKVREYQEMKEQIEQTVGRINGKLSDGSWRPIQYIYRGFPIQQLVSYYMIADFAMVTPLRDGMNLVAKEYCAARTDNSGALILSEFTGASHQMPEAFTVNPYNKLEVCEAIRQAIELPAQLRAFHMEQLREGIARDNIHHWLTSYLEALLHAVRHRSKAFIL